MKPKLIAFYLPQFHTIPENNMWWGNGFTEWNNVKNAVPLYCGHYQPRIPDDALGYYNLLDFNVRNLQAKMAQDAGIYGFCYWHYWFGNGKQLLQRPFEEVVTSGKPNFPFCLAWANESWYKKVWANIRQDDQLLIEQQYGGIQDYTEHFYKLLPAFKDKRYICIDGKPLFVIYKPLASPEINIFIKTWRELAKTEGLKGFYFVGHCLNEFNRLQEYENMDLDAINTNGMAEFLNHFPFGLRAVYKVIRQITGLPYIVNYKTVSRYFNPNDKIALEKYIPTILTGWDHTPRGGKIGYVYTGYNPQVLEKQLEKTLDTISKKSNPIVFLKSWNEWGEGNYLEPDQRYGYQYLNVIKKLMMRY